MKSANSNTALFSVNYIVSEGNWFTENANITITLKANTTRKTAIIQKNDGSTQTLTATFWNTDSKDITIRPANKSQEK